MNENMVSISRDKYEAILELAYKAAMLKEAVLNSATLDYYKRELYFGGGSEVVTILKYAFTKDYESRLRELQDKEKAEEGADDER